MSTNSFFAIRLRIVAFCLVLVGAACGSDAPINNAGEPGDDGTSEPTAGPESSTPEPDGDEVPEPLPTTELPADFCEALALGDELDDDPQTSQEAEATMAALIEHSQQLVDLAPPELADGAADFALFFVRVDELAAAEDYDPEFLESDAIVDAVGEEIYEDGRVWLSTVEDRCESSATTQMRTREIEVTYQIPEMFTGENFRVRALADRDADTVMVADNTGSATLSILADPSIEYLIQVIHDKPDDGTDYFCTVGAAYLEPGQTRLDFEVSDDFACTGD